MARSRNIKPGFYDNEDLAECSDGARLLFPALWMLADRDGYLEDRPKRIKKFAFGYDQRDVEPLMDELREHGFLESVESENGSKWLRVPHFTEHQSPHIHEPSRFESYSSPIQEPDNTGSRTGIQYTVRGKRNSVRGKRETVRGKIKAMALTRDYTPGFNGFFKVFPRSDNKRAAFKAYCLGPLLAFHEKSPEKSITDLDTACGAHLVAVVKTHMAAPPGTYLNRETKQVTPLASTWLNQGRWEDDLPRSGADLEKERTQGILADLKKSREEKFGQ